MASAGVEVPGDSSEAGAVGGTGEAWVPILLTPKLSLARWEYSPLTSLTPRRMYLSGEGRLQRTTSLTVKRETKSRFSSRLTRCSSNIHLWKKASWAVEEGNLRTRNRGGSHD